jgi:hypothetical protein
MSDEKMVPLSEAENEVKVVTQRLALLHLAYAKTIVKEFGWEEGKQLILNSIKRYGEYVAERVKKGHQSLPKYGFWEHRMGNGRVRGCELGKIMLELGEPVLGSMYCLIDPAKTMAANQDEKQIHTKNIIVEHDKGYDECKIDTVPTTEEEIRDFKANKDWTYVDPLLYNYLKDRKG